jgi:hypothetical protein
MALDEVPSLVPMEATYESVFRWFRSEPMAMMLSQATRVSQKWKTRSGCIGGPDPVFTHP